MKAKQQRMVLAGLAVVAIVAAALLALSALKDQAAFFYAPSDLVRDGVPAGKAIRLGGMVKAGSVAKAADGVTTHFVVTDFKRDVPVSFTGILPDLFRENSGVVAEGALAPDGHFAATNILAKHDEKYMPPELANTAAGAMHESKSIRR